MRAFVAPRTLLFVVVIGFAATRAIAQNAHFGINAHDVSGIIADKTTELGADIVRVVYGWDRIESDCKGCFNWAITDKWRDEARRTRRSIFGTLGYTPRWANGGAAINTPPIKPEDWYDFVYATVDRYKDDVFLWGIWNEPNLDSYFRNGDRQAYEALVRTAASAIHAANPLAQVLGPEVSQHAIPNGWYAAVMNDVGDLFDIVTVHWYVDGPPIERFMDEAVRPWAMRKEVWLAEVGVKPCQTNLGEMGQALLYQRVLQAFQLRRHWWTGVIFYDLHDDPPDVGDCSSGITRDDWSNRPAFLLYQAFMKAFR
jgi:hypothetical protein